jgi:radical SAM superfamily enzyme YgiQ (UPF0313 family)
MKVLLVRPVDKQIEKIETWPPLGLGYLATALRKNHSVEILDCPRQKITYEQFDTYVRQSKPDVVGFSLISLSLISTKKSASIVKQINPKITVIVGGPTFSGAPRERLEYFEEADFGFQGEADKGLPLLLDRLSSGTLHNLSEIPGLIWRNNSKIIVNPPEFIENLDSLGFPSWDLLALKDYPTSLLIYYLISKNEWKNATYAPISIIRGCSYNCTFCGCGTVSGKAVRRRDIAHIIRESELLYDKYHVRMLMMIDDNLAFDKSFLREFCEGLIESGIKINWAVPLGLRLDNLDEETLIIMERSGCCYFAVGIESGSQRILNLMKKGTTLQMIREKISLVKKVTMIQVGGLFILGYPSETKEEIKSTIHFAKDLELDIALFYLFVPLPGSKWYEYLKQNDRLYEINWNKAWGKEIAFVHNSISMRQLNRQYIFAYLNFYLRIKIILNLHKRDPFFFLRFIIRFIGRIKSLLVEFLQ